MGHTRYPKKWKNVPYSNPDAGKAYGLAGMRMKERSGLYLQEAATAPGHVTSANSRATGHPPKKPSSFAGAAPQNTQRLA